MSGAATALVLASGSPRRRELLSRLGLDVEVAAQDVDESPVADETPGAHAMRVARLKGRAAIARYPESPVLAADTVVALGQRIFGKPRDRADAAAMLRDLAGKTHTVLTALVLLWNGQETAHLEQARVTMAPFRRDLWRWYAGTGEGDDKAGAYAVQGQGALLVERVEGNVQAVVGLPLAALPDLLARVNLVLVASGAGLALTSRVGSPRRGPTA
jgi:septum formation protein